MPVSEKISSLWSNISSTTLMFFTKGDMNGRHNFPGKPALNPILGILFIIGFIISLKNYKNRYSLLFIIYFFLSIIPALMTYPWENPNMLRTYTCLPSTVFFIGQGIIVLFLFFSHKFKKYLQIICLVIVVFICFSSAYEIRTYFIYQPLAFKHSFDQPDYLPIIYKNAQNQQK
jgi:phosphatidylserine synthase